MAAGWCPNRGVLLRPSEEATVPTIRQRECGLDVVTHVGEKRSTQAMSLPKIHQSLVDDYGLKISERHVSNLFKVFLALVHCVNADFAPLRQKLEKQGHLILAIDGVSRSQRHISGTSFALLPSPGEAPLC